MQGVEGLGLQAVDTTWRKAFDAVSLLGNGAHEAYDRGYWG